MVGGIVSVVVVWVVRTVTVDAGVAVVLVGNVEVVVDVVGTDGVVVGFWLMTPEVAINMYLWKIFFDSSMSPAEMPPAVTATTLIVKNNLIDWFANFAVFVALSKQQHTSQSMKAPRQKPNAKERGF